MGCVRRSILITIAFVSLAFAVQCVPEDGRATPQVGTTLQELLLEDARVCSDLSGHYPQALIEGLSIQLIDEMRCMDSGWLEYYTPCKELGCIWANGPQPLAARPEVLDALRAAATSKNDFITINAAYRDVGMQYFSRWRNENCDGNFMAAIPGRSNHQGGRAIDVQSHAYWADTLIDHGFNRPYYPKDLPHFELVGNQQYRDESEQLKKLSILAFQVLWNKNNPSDQIDEDGLYGAETKERLGNSPVEGFPIYGCAEPEPDPCEDFPCADGCDEGLCQQYCDGAPCAEGCDAAGCVQFCDNFPCADGCDPEGCDDQCAHSPCADGCDAQACQDYCEADPCADGCGEAECDTFCHEVPCAEGCPIEGCADLCEDDPCAPGCDPAQCTGFCDDFPCEEGCDPQKCAVFCILNPCDPSCGADACTTFCEKTPCASVCEGSEACETPDQEPCRDASCDDPQESDDPAESVDPVEPSDPQDDGSQPPADVNNLTSERGGCAAAPASAPSLGWLFSMGALWLLSRRTRRMRIKMAAQRM